ncbi:hypothetical protein [Demequina oxidasica]|uniref:hypothetical protein n=1 Tax=Demequina oxidasica TaxID=676199 RepID=UPI00078625E9|nr:hypothetical protein [Demequina oxidasica]
MRRIVALLIAVPLLLTACSSTPESRGPGLGGDPFADQSPIDSAPDDNGAGVPAGEVDCGSISQQQLLTFGYGVQTLSQLNNQPTVDGVNEGSIAFSTEAFADAVAALRTLEGHGVDPYGDPTSSLDYYAEVNTEAENLLAYDTPVPEAEFTAYEKATGGASQIITEQESISASYNANCAG